MSTIPTSTPPTHPRLAREDILDGHQHTGPAVSPPIRVVNSPIDALHEIMRWIQVESHRHEVSPRSVEDYKWGLTRHLLPFFKDHRLSQITIAEVDRYKNTKVRERERRTEGRALSNGSINETLNLLAQVLEMAVEYEHIQFNPARGARRRLKAAQPKRTWLEPEQVKPLLDATVRGLRAGKTMPDPRMRALFATAICTGLRIGELLALRWGEVNLAQGRLTVLDAKTEAGAGREIDIWPELHDVLASYKAAARHAKPTDYVFATATGRADSARTSPSASSAPWSVPTSARRPGHPADPDRVVAPLASTHVRLAALPARREPRLRHAPDGPHRPQARPAHLHQGHGRATRRGPGARLVGVLDGAHAGREAQSQATSRMRMKR